MDTLTIAAVQSLLPGTETADWLDGLKNHWSTGDTLIYREVITNALHKATSLAQSGALGYRQAA